MTRAWKELYFHRNNLYGTCDFLMDIFVIFGKFYRHIFIIYLIMRLVEKNIFLTNEQWLNKLNYITRKTFFDTSVS